MQFELASVLKTASLATQVQPLVSLAYYSVPFLLYFADGDMYDGEFSDGDRNGQGTYYAKKETEFICLNIFMLQYSSAYYTSVLNI